MKLGFVAGYGSAQAQLPLEQIIEAERLGYDSVWTSEAYGTDAVSVAAWILARTTRIRVGTAIMQMPARTPTCTAMTAMTLDALSGGRFLLGIGPSGPRVAEGWYGVAYGKPLARTREYINIIRQIAARRGPLVHQGEVYRIPYDGPGATGLGTPIKSILHADEHLQIYTAAVTPKGITLAAEIADGVFPVWMNPERQDLVEQHVTDGLARGGGRSRADFTVAPMVPVSLDDDLERARAPVRAQFALYIGGMGPRGRNFYHDYTCRMGYEAAANRIQDLYLSGQREAAAAAVPDQLLDEVALIGPAARIRERIGAWRAAGRAGRVNTMMAGGASIEALRLLAEELL